MSGEPFMQELNQKVDRIETQLDALYFDSLALMYTIYEDGRSRASRSSKPPFFHFLVITLFF